MAGEKPEPAREMIEAVERVWSLVRQTEAFKAIADYVAESLEKRADSDKAIANAEIPGQYERRERLRKQAEAEEEFAKWLRRLRGDV
jgi:hypothetical protein